MRSSSSLRFMLCVYRAEPFTSRRCTDLSEIPNAKPSLGVLKLMSSCFLPRADAAVRFVVALMSSRRSNRADGI